MDENDVHLALERVTLENARLLEEMENLKWVVYALAIEKDKDHLPKCNVPRMYIRAYWDSPTIKIEHCHPTVKLEKMN